MPKGYWVVHNTVNDADSYREKYVPLNQAPIAAHGGKFLVRGGQSETMEGSLRPRCVIIEFPSYQAALDCFRSEGYEAASVERRKFSEGDVLIVEGYDGPQPGDT
ncbi:MAG: DUF1330 domain-containing protein [Pseudomonadota bacterium]